MSASLNPSTDMQFAQHAAWSHDVLHIYNDNYLGIRSSASAFPGQKLVLPNIHWHYQEHLAPTIDLVRRSGASRVIFHGMSNAVYETAKATRRAVPKLSLYGMWHGGPSQWVGMHEAVEFTRFLELDHEGVYARSHIMKAGCNALLQSSADEPLVNSAPRPVVRPVVAMSRTALVPAPPSLHKNLYGNLCAAELSQDIDLVLHYAQLSSRPLSLQKAKHVPYENPSRHQNLMQECRIVLNASTMDCHPMVDLEAAAVGRPSVHMELHLGVLEDHPLTVLCTIKDPASIDSIHDTLTAVLGVSDAALFDLSLDYAAAMTAISVDRMTRFLYA